jgi:hypothetical protein
MSHSIMPSGYFLGTYVIEIKKNWHILYLQTVLPLWMHTVYPKVSGLSR